ncbi:hypothetical protein T492DRAFT_1146237 [Pavlovales sp. CCMP2436]|nr:hypothetical protein T492DRAFT_1146237 [Pavlovales sp. CCMP2436]
MGMLGGMSSQQMGGSPMGGMGMAGTDADDTPGGDDRPSAKKRKVHTGPAHSIEPVSPGIAKAEKAAKHQEHKNRAKRNHFLCTCLSDEKLTGKGRKRHAAACTREHAYQTTNFLLCREEWSASGFRAIMIGEAAATVRKNLTTNYARARPRDLHWTQDA